MPVPFRIIAVAGADASAAAAAAVAAVVGGGQVLSQQLDVLGDDIVHQALAARGFPGVTVICGGDDARALIRAARDQLDFEHAGVTQLYRQRLFEIIGAQAALAELVCGPCGGGALVAIPGGATQVTLALAELILPLAEQLCPTEEADEDDLAGGVEVVQMGSEPGPEAGTRGTGGSGWEAGLLALGATLDRGRFPPLPEAFERLAPARNVLEAAGERGMVTLADGRTYAAFGFPDLLRARSKVLMVADGEPLAEVIAIHRFPRRVGVTVHGEAGFLPSADLDPDGPSVERTGLPCPGFGTLFAVDGSAVYYKRDRKVYSWDGKKERMEGSASQVLASLLLRWSQR